MQGFNKYYPPDYDGEKHKSLNSYHGKHALGDRARKIDKGILITRFELPFNIWCLNCNSHIGMGVRYNAEKKKIGNYLSTPIFSFRCKCHLCSGWFEIQTDPQNTRYVVVSGAKKKEEDWNPEENGGFAIHENNPGPNAEAPDPFAAVEKTTASLNHVNQVQQPRISTLEDLSARQSADPYTLSTKLRRTFREEKKVLRRKREEEEGVLDRYALPKRLGLVSEDDVREEAKVEWDKGRKDWEREEVGKRRMLEDDLKARIRTPSVASSKSRPTSSSSRKMISAASATRPQDALASRLILNSMRATKPFPLGASGSSQKPRAKDVGVVVRK